MCFQLCMLYEKPIGNEERGCFYMGMQKHNILVTGATGYIGSHLLRALQKRDENVYALVRKTSDQSTIKIDASRIYVYSGCLDEMLDFFNDKEIDTVFHLATYQIAEHTKDNVDLYLQANIIMGVHLLEALKANGSKHDRCFINYGTYWQHYNQESYRAVNLYAATKEAFSRIVDYYTDAFDMRAITLELYDTYGEFDTRNKIINCFLHQSENILEMSPGEQKIDLLYIDDVISGSIYALSEAETLQPGIHKRYCLSTNMQYSIKEVAAIFEKVFNKKLNIVWGGRPYKKREIYYPYRNGVQLPGWQFKYTLEEGLQKMKERMNENSISQLC